VKVDRKLLRAMARKKLKEVRKSLPNGQKGRVPLRAIYSSLQQAMNQEDQELINESTIAEPIPE
jgi:hypothetical protein